MAQVIVIFIAFSLIPIMVRRGFKLSSSIIGTALALGILSGIGLKTFANVLLGVFINDGSKDTVLTVALVGVLGGLMGHYGLLDKMVDAMLRIINDKKKILMILPPMMGMLTIPGGAALSAPFVNNIGEDLDVAKPTRAAINLTYRHISIFVLPYNTSLLLLRTSLKEINIYKFILMNLAFILPALGVAYLLYIKDVRSEKVERKGQLGRNLLNLLVLTSPIYISVVINSIFSLPFYLAMIPSIIIVFLLSDKKDFAKVMVRSINWDALITVVGVLTLKDTILNMDKLLAFIENLFGQVNNNLLILGVFLLVGIFFGLITGNSSVPLAINLPILAMMNLPLNTLYVYLFFVFASGFIGYYFSPIHLCQVLTISQMGVSTIDMYKEYKLYIPALLGILILSTSLFFLIL